MKTICVTNNKGGVAKTVTTANLAFLLASRGFKVLLVDIDPQANLTSFYGVQGDKGTTYDLMNSKEARPVQARENLFVLPSEGGLVAYEAEHVNDGAREHALKENLKQFNKGFDLCFIDTPPAVGSLLVNALVASDFCLIPSTVDGFSVQGISQVLEIFNSVKESFNKNLSFAGVVLTMYDKRNLTRNGEAFLREQFGGDVFTSTIRNTVAVREACTQGRTLFEAKYNPVQEDFKGVADELLTKIQNNGTSQINH